MLHSHKANKVELKRLEITKSIHEFLALLIGQKAQCETDLADQVVKGMKNLKAVTDDMMPR